MYLSLEGELSVLLLGEFLVASSLFEHVRDI
jgi:hypothetical protein